MLRPLVRPLVRALTRSPMESRGLRPTLSLDFTNGGVTDSRVTYSGGANGTSVNSAGLIVDATTPRFDYNPVTLAPLGLLVEEARTNLALHSQEFDNAVYHKSTVTVTADATIGPDGATTADKLITDASAGYHDINQSIGSRVASVAYTYSFYAKAAEIGFCLPNIDSGLTGSQIQALINLTTGEVSHVSVGLTATTQNAGNGWWRVYLTAIGDSKTTGFLVTINTTDETGNPNFTGNGSDGIYIWGFQIEQGSFPTSYIPTTSASVTRSADSAVMTGTNFSDWYNATVGTFVAGFDTVEADATPGNVFEVGDGTFNKRMNAFISSTPTVNFVVTDGGVQLANFSTGSYTVGTVAKVAAAYALNNFAGSLNGGTVATDASGTIPTVNALYIGRQGPGGAYLNGHVRSIRYFNQRLPNATLQGMTA